MPKYEITDNVTGKTYEIEGPYQPSEDEVSELLGTVKQEKRPDLLQELGKELKYQPLMRTDLDPAQRLRHEFLRPAAAAVKGAGAVGQRITSSIANMMLEEQRRLKAKDKFMHPIGIAKAGIRGLTTEPTHRYLDVFRNDGMSEIPANILDLAADIVTPGIGEVASGVGKLYGRGAARVKAIGAGLGRNITKAHSTALLGVTPDAAERAIEKGFAGVAEVTPSSAHKNLSGLRKRALAGSAAYEDATQANFEKVLVANRNKPLPFQTIDEVGTNNITLKSRDMLSNADVMDVEGDVGGIAGAKALKSILDDVDAKISSPAGYVSVGDARKWLKQLRPIAKNEKLGEVYAAANQLKTDISKAIGKASPELARASRKYRSMSMTLYGQKGSVPSTQEILGMSSKGSEPLAEKGFYKQHPAAQKALAHLEKNIPENFKFLERLKDASYALEYSPIDPKKTLSLAALGTFLAKGNPALMTGVGIAGAATSPKIAGTAYSGLYKASRNAAKWAKRPQAGAIRDIMSRLAGAGTYRAGMDRLEGQLSEE